MLKVSPSLLSADFGNLNRDIKTVEDAGADWLHLDVMDGAFVPNISFGPCVISDIRKSSNLFFDVHLMINEPIRYIQDYQNAGADCITVHVEACSDVEKTLSEIRNRGLKSGLSVKPKTPVSDIEKYIHLCDLVLVMTVEPGFGGQKLIPETIEKISEVKALRDKHSLNFEIQADGGIGLDNISQLKERGLTVVVAGSAIFKSDNVVDTINKFRNL